MNQNLYSTPPTPSESNLNTNQHSSLNTNATEHAGFSPRILSLITQAKKLNQLTIFLIYAAIGAFLLFGTLKSLPQFRDSTVIYQCFYYIPYGLIGLTIPMTVYIGFILYRYRLSQPSMIALCVIMGFGLFVVSSYVAFASWMGVAFMFRANLKRFFAFIEDNKNPNQNKY